ncbi:uncharacterized protein N7496_007279 [Penicillium cataractarum]|uniref:Major facilitator superfamily (MFS) profile domain-containing protein n=1 Tax=Penicillium cataractarum TaxID=2100454 RepID=A0A9W9V739_9EURO|nr:uncharacterized protein N7496_007279 [Penicillium cataractarum]KAJ5371187.1 hypothetical protein N7496_007279 [Penicillium cataractarum]
MASTNPHRDEKTEHTAAEMVETVSQTLECVNEGAWASAKKNPKVILYSLAAGVSSMLWGFDIGVNSISVSLPGFKMVFGYEYEGELLISATWNALWTAMTSLGMLIGSIICGWVSDRGGRRLGFLVGSALSLLGVGLEYAANEPGMLLAGKIQFTGIAFYSQALYMLGISGLPTALTFQLALGGFGVAMLGNIISWFIMNYVGRRPLLLTGILLNGLCLMSVGIAGCFTTTAALYYIGYMMNFAQLFYAPTVGAVSWTISAEVSSVNVRAKTQSLAIGTNALVSWAMNFIAPYLINTDEANLGGKAAFVWMALSFISLAWAWFEVPELKGRTFAELDEIFVRMTPTRKFKKATVDSSSNPKDVSS